MNNDIVYVRQEKESIQLLKKQGVQIIELSDEELKTMRQKVQKNVWPRLENPEYDIPCFSSYRKLELPS